MAIWIFLCTIQAQGLFYSTEMMSKIIFTKLLSKPSIVKTSQGILISFPVSYDLKKIKGKASFYRSSNKKLDFDVMLNNSAGALLVPASNLVAGLWDISLIWNYENKDYISKQKIYF